MNQLLTAGSHRSDASPRLLSSPSYHFISQLEEVGLLKARKIMTRLIFNGSILSYSKLIVRSLRREMNKTLETTALELFQGFCFWTLFSDSSPGSEWSY